MVDQCESRLNRDPWTGWTAIAPVIRQYARLHPQRVAGLVAVDGPLDMRTFPPPEFSQPPPPMIGPEGLKAREGMIRSMFTPPTPMPLQKEILSMMLAAPEATANGAMASDLRSVAAIDRHQGTRTGGVRRHRSGPQRPDDERDPAQL